MTSTSSSFQKTVAAPPNSLEAATASGGGIMDASHAWHEWPSFKKETLDPEATLAAKGRIDQNTSSASHAPEEIDPVPDLMYIVPRPLHGKHGKALGKIHTVDPSNISRSLCGWRFTSFADSEGHIFSTTPYPSENVAIEGALRCYTCSRGEEQLSL